MTNVEVAATVAPNQLLDALTLDNIKEYSNDIDIIELRIDQWEDRHLELLKSNLEQLQELNINANILVTYRTISQGGKGEMTHEAYMTLLKEIIKNHHCQMIDIEWDSDFDVFAHRDLIDLAHRYNKQVVVSYHNFQETPDIDILKFTYYKMNQLNPDYVKIAVMPQDKEDVATLLEAVATSADTLDAKVIGISMSGAGLVSRTAQGVFGGTVSYGCLGEPQAPGQIHVKTLKQQLLFYSNH